MFVVGLDPGLNSGAWGCIDHHGDYVGCGDIEHDLDRVLPFQLRTALLGAIPPGEDAMIFIEQVFGMPQQGISSTSKFMRAAGCIEAVAQLLNHPVIFVTPQIWKKHHHLIKTEKIASLELARAKWPQAPLTKMKHHNRAEALLIAAYGLEVMA